MFEDPKVAGECLRIFLFLRQLPIKFLGLLFSDILNFDMGYNNTSAVTPFITSTEVVVRVALLNTLGT